MKVTILSGVPGSGKSTLALKDFPSCICSADDFFMTGPNDAYQFDASKLGAAHGACLKKFAHWMTDPFEDPISNVYVDNTNTTAVEIAPYYALALAYGHQVEIVTMMVPEDKLALCAERNRHGVPLKSITRMAENIQRRRLMPYWNHRTIEAEF